MKNIRSIFFLLLIWCIATAQLLAQDANCASGTTGTEVYTGGIFFNYGSVTGAFNNKNRHNSSVGEPLVGTFYDQHYSAGAGFWTRFIAPPTAPTVVATQGDLLDRIQLRWAVDPLSPSFDGGFNIYRDGIFLASADKNARSYNDFNVIAGRPYNYEVRGVNIYGEGVAGKALGFQVPNGVVTGLVETVNGSPVPGALVTLMPMQGFSAKFGPADGAFAEADTAVNTLLPVLSQWSLSFWIKTDVAAANAGVLQLAPYALYIQAANSAGGHEGIIVSAPGVSAGSFFVNFPDSTKNGWHHVALTFNNNQGQLYLDGVLADISAMTAPAVPTTGLMLGARTGNSGWAGRLDELRIYYRKLDELDLGEIMEGTASSTTPGLQSYWKMDEEQGFKSFDLIRRNKLYFCGVTFDGDRPPVRTSAMTNEQGYYRIESASYGTGTTFLAEPFKNFYRHRALKFNRTMSDYAFLPNFALPPKATIEAWVNNASPNGNQVILSKKWNTGNEFRIVLVQSGTDNMIRVHFNGVNQDYGLLGNGYQHLAFTIDSSGANRTVTGYKNGTPIGSFTYSGISGNWSDNSEAWLLGTRKLGAGLTAHFDGLIDEVAFYDTTLTAVKIQEHVQGSRDPQERGLLAYFPLDEGSGNRLNNSGSILTGTGATVGTEWSAYAPNQSTTPHEFTPATRQVTLNPSVTSVDQVDFTDRSTIPVSGFVRYQNTDCFAQGVEILVNGESYSPAIFTDSTGKFLIDLDPGATLTLSPKFEDHLFSPATWDLVNVVNPIAGILFSDITVRKISGQVAGGFCKLPILANVGTPQGTVCQIKVRSPDGCFERLVTLDNNDGLYEFAGLPPIEMTVAVVEHSDPAIKTAFQVQGGYTTDLSDKDTAVVDFTYFAPPQVTVSGLEPEAPCTQAVLEQGTLTTLEIRLTEMYLGEACHVDSAKFRIIDGFGGGVKDTVMGGGKLLYTFRAGLPNPAPPYLQTMQIIGTTLAGNETSLALQAIITGLRSKESFFTTKLNMPPSIVLHDPPGDGSYSFIEEGETHCSEITVFLEDKSKGVYENLLVSFGPKTDEFEVIAHIDQSFEKTLTKSNDSTLSVCHTAVRRISTSDQDLIVGSEQGGDVYMGGGFNLILGLTDKVTVTNCVPQVEVIVTVEPGDFETTYIYSEYHITNNIIRYLQLALDDIKADPAKPDSDTLEYHNSIVNWNNIITDNKERRAKAESVRNISFDAFTTYESSETVDSTSTGTTVQDTVRENRDGTELGLFVVGIGASIGVGATHSNTHGQTTVNSNQKSITTGYVLADDDAGDAFTVDIGIDPFYKTPVFNIVNGQSNCPWEPGTAHREGNKLSFRDGSVPVAVDVPANEAAVYKFTLGNISATNEDWTYVLSTGPESNPHGAKIFLNGAPLDHPILYAIPYGTSIPVTITLERGPEEYDYDSLEVVLYSLCEDERATALGIRPDDDTILYSAQYISAHFIRPCSEVEINVPEQDWVVFPDPLTPGSDDERRITVSGYDTTVTDFQLVRVQYRRSDGDGAWVNIPGISDRYNPNWSGYADLPNPKPPKLQPVFTQFFWETTGLSDGPYEIRAVAVCSGDASDKPGYSRVINGRIDREPPSLVGVPQPSDGVYHLGDEISFTFNKHINCNKLIPADQTQANNAGLYDAASGQLIDIDVTCFENKIVIDPNFQNEFFENRILRAELHDIEDKTGNKSTYFEWEFYVDRNELAWLTDSLGMTKYEDDTRTATASIHNRGGYPAPFSIQNAPDWVRVVPDQGTLAPNEIRPIRFEVDSTLGFGLWSDTIVLHTETGQNPFFMGGDEGLPFGVRVVCRPPNWNLSAGLYENTMNMVLRLNIQGVFSTDVEDIVAAYIGDELRGRAHVQYVPQLDAYLAYLTVYGNPDDVLDDVGLEVWDASACLRYSPVQESFTFQPDHVIGIPDNPQVVHTNSLVLREVPFGYGWNWLSFNLAFPDNSLNAALASLQHPAGDLVKSQTAFATYSGAWFGSLGSLGNTGMYIYKADLPDTLKMTGNLIDPASTPIPLVSGWNWIGYVPNYTLPINEALASIPAQTGDLIKSQLAFAQYLNPTFGWVGNLKYMQPPNGYQIKTAGPGVLTYPPATNARENAIASRGEPASLPSAYWTVNPAQFEHSMTLIGMLSVSGLNSTGATMELGAFAGNEVRGSAQAVFIEPLQAFLFFLTSYANSGGEQLQFKLFDSNTGQVQFLNEKIYFAPDVHQGSIESPVPFTLQTSGTLAGQMAPAFDIQPNPFGSQTAIQFVLPYPETVTLTVTDAGGRELLLRQVEANCGLNTVVWDGHSDAGSRLNPGVYFVRLQTGNCNVSRKVVVQRLP